MADNVILAINIVITKFKVSSFTPSKCTLYVHVLYDFSQSA